MVLEDILNLRLFAVMERRYFVSLERRVIEADIFPTFLSMDAILDLFRRSTSNAISKSDRYRVCLFVVLRNGDADRSISSDV